VFGQWINTQQTGQRAAAKALAEEALALAQEQTDPAFLLQGHHATWTTLFSFSELPSCLHHAEQGISLYDIDKHRSHAFLYGGHDPGVCCRIHIAVCRWFLGYPDQAVETAHSATNLARELSHPFSQVLAFIFSAFLHHYRRDPGSTRECAEAAIALCAEQGVAPHYAAVGSILRGWSVAAEGQQEGLAEIHRGVADWRDSGAKLRLSYLLGVMAEAYGRTEQPDKGLNALAEALALVEASGERKWEPELYRLKGELLLSGSADDQGEAEDCFNRAVEVARHLSAKSLELRAATSLARQWRDQGKPEEAHGLLAPIYGWFTEGFDTADLKEAKVLLDELK
jgi:predicted ATPase